MAGPVQRAQEWAEKEGVTEHGDDKVVRSDSERGCNGSRAGGGLASGERVEACEPAPARNVSDTGQGYRKQAMTVRKWTVKMRPSVRCTFENFCIQVPHGMSWKATRRQTCYVVFTLNVKTLKDRSQQPPAARLLF